MFRGRSRRRRGADTRSRTYFGRNRRQRPRNRGRRQGAAGGPSVETPRKFRYAATEPRLRRPGGSDSPGPWNRREAGGDSRTRELDENLLLERRGWSIWLNRIMAHGVSNGSIGQSGLVNYSLACSFVATQGIWVMVSKRSSRHVLQLWNLFVVCIVVFLSVSVDGSGSENTQISVTRFECW